MAGWLGIPTLGKMSVDAAGRLWRRLKNKEKPKDKPEVPRFEVDVHTFYTDSADSIGYTNSEPDTLDCLETIHDWVNASPDTYSMFGAWHHPSEPASIASFDGEVDLVRSVSVRGEVQPAAKPAKRGIKDVFKNVKKAAFKKRDNSG
ncbi:hypothetical protein N0V84_000415 [Fusarium piperis]|uniref:Uncharacterized protein n=1 Tax=Fusarium piperis TaxID=1435070 RepID=A0A9W8WMX6_9HYPO|nr:hypothetical protein N0V84_000415 [Fusarium piperis]